MYFIESALNNTETNNRIKQNTCRLFCPGFLQITNHKKIGELLQRYNFNCLFLNSTCKFVLNTGEEIKTKIDNEIYKILHDIIKKYPGNIAIIGNACVERGLTFNSKDYFNFTDHIFTPGICKKYNKKLQMLSRSCGNKNYIEEHTIYIDKKDFNDCKAQVEHCIKIEAQKLYSYNEKHFIKYTHKQSENDKHRHYKTYKTQEKAIKFCEKDLNYKPRYNKSGICGWGRITETFNGNNPTLEYLIDNDVGLGPKNPVRCIPTSEGSWFVKWDDRYLKK